MIFSLDNGVYKFFQQDPDGHLPNLFNDVNLTDYELTLFLRNIIHRQSPGVQRIVSALRTPDNRPVNKE